MLIAQISDLHIKRPGRLAYQRVDTAAMLRACVAELAGLDPRPDLVLITGDLVDVGSDEEYGHLADILAPLPMPILAVPGNHDGREGFRRAFGEAGHLPERGFLQFAVDRGPLRVVGLDTLDEGRGGGLLCAERLDWLAATLAAAPDRPTLIAMHHPPFATGIAHMDAIGLDGAEAFTAIVAQHPQIEAIVCGHLHRTITATVGGRRAMTIPSPAHQVALDLTPAGPSAFRMEPPGYCLHAWVGGRLVSHGATIGSFDGPHPFFDAAGRLID